MSNNFLVIVFSKDNCMTTYKPDWTENVLMACHRSNTICYVNGQIFLNHVSLNSFHKRLTSNDFLEWLENFLKVGGFNSFHEMTKQYFNSFHEMTKQYWVVWIWIPWMTLNTDIANLSDWQLAASFHKMTKYYFRSSMSIEHFLEWHWISHPDKILLPMNFLSFLNLLLYCVVIQLWFVVYKGFPYSTFLSHFLNLNQPLFITWPNSVADQAWALCINFLEWHRNTDLPSWSNQWIFFHS